MVLNEDPVTLIIKDPTLQIDKTVECGMSWTIERLKNHIYDVYPNKPKPADQRLIYYGHLLGDKETLQEILSRFDSGETVHTVHLVCISSRDGMPSSRFNTNSDANGERVPSGVEPPNPDPRQAVPPTPEDTYRFVMNSPGYQPWMNDVNGGYFQQLAWAQHYAYTHYLNQYMDMLARQNGGQPMYAVPGAEREAPRPADPAPERADEDDRNQDWLDYFYTFARLLVLLSFVYFYSSPARFLIVSFLAIVMYLYQIGFFRVNHIQPLENNNEVLNNNIAADNNNLVRQGDGVAAGVEAQEPAVREEVVAQPMPTPVVAAAAAVERPSIIALTWIFFSSFFASLFPEHQNAV